MSILLNSQQFAEDVCNRVRMTFVLPKSFAVLSPDFIAAQATPAFAGVHVFVHAMLSPKPLALTGMAGEGVQLGGHVRRNIDNKIRRGKLHLLVGYADNAVRSFEVVERCWAELHPASRWHEEAQRAVTEARLAQSARPSSH